MPLEPAENELILETLPGAAYRCLTKPPWPMQYVSPGIRLLCSYTAEDFIQGRVRWGDLIHPMDRQAVAAAVAAAVRRRIAFRISYRIIDPEMGEQHVLERGVALPDREALVGVIFNISEQVAREEQFRSLRAELDGIRQTATGSLAVALAHEINQPLGAITNYAATARDLAGGSGELGEIIGLIEHNAVLAGEIVSRFRTLSRSPALRIQPVQAGDLVLRTIDLFRANHPEVEIAAELRGDALIDADPVWMQQLLLNLLHNAADAIAGAGRGAITIVSRAAGDRVEIAIENGSGPIPASVLSRVFESGYTTKPQGMGLGLAICKAIVDAHAGTIRMENVTAGVRVRLRLPRMQAR